MDMAQARKPGWWYPYIFVGAFLVVVAVNFVMAYFANSTFSGISTERPYEKGLAFNQTIETARKQEALNWSVDLQVDPADSHGAHVTVTYKDAAGQPVDGMEVKALFVRPTAKGHDREVRLAPTGPGTYATQQQLPLAGVWDMALVATGKDMPYSVNRRIVVP
ncbi:integral membrane protein linked to a cation pump [Paramagnetospirillum caucaseum]|uniref:Integral membrane protein linked to a cation pump n=1 Tax=Paramagnetospirillum caucaseum TaxID=1244869 RepID=M3A8E2_9PROT|nr:FixH family protein [Paramagnetospirillum caucaseum]EME68789.1 integral membrane protein linked to a cation pump [Paramagnetospirillum caucaseum]